MKNIVSGTWFAVLILLFFQFPATPSNAVAAEPEVPKKAIAPFVPFTPGIFPCSQCHSLMPANKKQRKLEMMHQDIVLKHMPDGWCLDCHNPDNRDKLRLINGKAINFDEAYTLCGQCHGAILRTWKAGLHGKRTGQWNGEKLYQPCVNCHWPHDPVFKSIEPMPPPKRPADIK